MSIQLTQTGIKGTRPEMALKEIHPSTESNYCQGVGLERLVGCRRRLHHETK
jgi:hypothetical protein